MPPSSRISLRAHTRGRPPKWMPFLRVFLDGWDAELGPYKSEHCAAISAGRFNREMRKHAPEAFSAFLRFRRVGLCVRLRRVLP